MKPLDGEKKKSASGVKTEGEGEAKIHKIGKLASVFCVRYRALNSLLC